MKIEDRMSVSNFLTDVFHPRNRHELLPSDRILLVWNKDKRENGELVRVGGVSMPRGSVEPGEHYIDAVYRETEEETMRSKRQGEALSICDKISVINDRRVFHYVKSRDKESEPEKDEDRNLIFKNHWHLTVVSRLLIPVDEIAISIGKPGIKKAEWHRFDRLPSGLYGSHKKRITDFYNRLFDRELFDYVFE